METKEYKKLFNKFINDLVENFNMDVNSLKKVDESENIGTIYDEDEDTLVKDTGYRITGKYSKWEYRIFWNEDTHSFSFL